MTNQSPDHHDVFTLPIEERISYYKRALDVLTPPRTFREQLLLNVYQCLLRQCEQQLAAA